MLFKYRILSGIKSIIEIQIITPEAKAQDDDIILLWSLILINMGIVPNMVARPAMVVKINGYNMVSPSKVYEINGII